MVLFLDYMDIVTREKLVFNVKYRDADADDNVGIRNVR